MRAQDLARLVALAAMWGASYLFMRYAVPHLGPVLMIELRVLVAGLLLAAFVYATGRTIEWRRHWRAWLFVGAIGLALPFALIAEALTTIDASTAAILNALSPLWATLFAALWIRDPITPTKSVGIVLCLAGTAVLVVVLTLTGWSYTARQLRAQALSLRKRDFLEAARVRGERRMYIVLVEIIPTMTSLIVASFLTNALYAVLFGSSLQFIGLGDPTVVSWGTMLRAAENNEAFQTGQALWIIAPGLCIVALGAAFALLNYAFDEIGNPALRPLRRARVKQSS